MVERSLPVMILPLFLGFMLLPLAISGADVADYSGSSGGVVERGGRVLITCRIAPFSAVKWHLNGVPVSRLSGYNVSVQQLADGSVLGRLQLLSAQPRHAGNYTCTSFVDNAFSLHVLSDEMISATADDNDGLLVLAGSDSLVLECNATSGTVESTRWYKSVEGSQRYPVDQSDRIEMSGGRLLINSPTENDAGNFTCSLTMDASRVPPIEKTIHVVTNATVRIKEKSFNVQEGEELVVNCMVFGKPTPVVTWTKDGESVVELVNASHRLQLSANRDDVADARLSLAELLRPGDRGDFCCHALNVANSARQCVVVRVKDRYASVWPCIGIVAEVLILTAIIWVFENKKTKQDGQDAADRSLQKDGAHQRK